MSGSSTPTPAPASTPVVTSTTPITGTSYIQRAIDITFELGSGNFGNTGMNIVTVSNLRVMVSVQQQGTPAAATANARVYGLTQDLMNQVSSLDTYEYRGRRNIMTIQAGDAINGMSVVYKGYMYSSVQNFENMPESFLEVTCVAPYYDQLAPATPISVQGSGDVATMFSGIARQMNKNFQNSGVNVKLSNQYLAGTVKQQADYLAMKAGINVDYSDPATLYIWPKGGQKSGVVPVISPATGLIGYPRSAGSQNIFFRTLFNPNIRPGIGGAIQMQSSYRQANGIWNVLTLTHDLASQTPGGPWFSDCECSQQLAGTT